MYFENLGLYLTYSCNLKCKHCSQDGSVNRDSTMDSDLLERMLTQAASNGIRQVALSGGEPFLVPPLVELASEICMREHIECWVVTNGWWAKSESKCFEILAHLDGISGISVSWDNWHAEFIDVERIRWIISACKKLGKRIEVGGCFIGSASENLKWMVDSIGEAVCGGVEVHNQPILWRGAVQKNFEKVDLPRHEPGRGGCRAANNPVVLPSGEVFACCGGSQDIGGDGFLYLGHAGFEPLAEIQKRGKANQIIKAIRHFGPEILLEGGMETVLDDISARTAYKQCDICVHIAQSARARDHAERRSRSEKLLAMIRAKEV